MFKFSQSLLIVGSSALLATAACSSTTGADADAADGTYTGGDTNTGTDTGTGTDTTGTDTGPTKQTFQSIVVWDHSEEQLDCTKAGSPGTDLDAVGLYRGGALIAVGKVKSGVFAQGSTPLCPSSAKIDAKQVDYPVGPVNGHVYSDKPDTGYFSLNGGSMELQFGACSASTADPASCDGTGAHVDLQDGDELAVWEVDDTYLPDGKGVQKGFAYAQCACYADEYQVDIRPTAGADTGSVTFPAAGAGDSADKKWFAGTHDGTSYDRIKIVLPK